MKYPSICLVTACHNHERYIEETINSVLSQNYPNLQYVVINDGSTDKSGQIIKKYKKYLHYYEDWSGYRKTVVPALNKAFSKTDGKIMGWLNSKNTLLSKSLFTIAEIFSQLKQVEWLTGIATTINDEGKIINARLRRKSIYDYLIGNWQVIQQESTFWRRSLWDRTGGYLKEQWAFDSELWTRFFLEAEHYHVNTVLGTYRRIPQAQAIRNKDEFREITEKALRKMHNKVSKKKFLKAKLYGLGKKYFWPILAIVPNKIYGKSPYLSEYSYKIISYSFDDNKWKIKKQNPFRKVI